MSKILWGKVEIPNVWGITKRVFVEFYKASLMYTIDAIITILAFVGIIYWLTTGENISGVVGILFVYAFGVTLRLMRLRTTMLKLRKKFE